MYEELIEELIENRVTLISALNELKDMKSIFIGLFIGAFIVIILAIVWGYSYE